MPGIEERNEVISKTPSLSLRLKFARPRANSILLRAYCVVFA
jgi:hypothetical protein